MTTAPEGRVLLGVIAGARGLKGQVKVKCFTARPADIAAYGALEDAAGARRFKLRVVAEGEGGVVAAIEGVTERSAAEALRGVRLYVARDALPETEEDEFYHVDLIGLRAEGQDGETLGMVEAVHHFGANDVLEVRQPEGQSLMLPFTREAVPVVDVAGGRLVVVPPPEVEAKRGPRSAGKEGTSS